MTLLTHRIKRALPSEVMRVWIWTTSIFSLLATVVQAQEGKFKVRALEEEIPRQLVDAFKRDFKGGTSEYWTIGSGQVLTEEYLVSDLGKTSKGEKPTYYFVGFSVAGLKGEAVYDHAGQLLFWKELVANISLPDSVKVIIGKNVSGYSFEGDQQVIHDGQDEVTCYLVTLNQASVLRRIMIDRSGKFSMRKK